VRTKPTGADVRAERYRQTPPITQGELAEHLGWYRQAITLIENGQMEESVPAALRGVQEIAKKRLEAERRERERQA